MKANTNTLNTLEILETLKDANASMEYALQPSNRRFLDKMFDYIDTFSLSEYDVELIKKDLIGMAMEAEQRNASFRDMIGRKPKTFCNDLVYAISGTSVPKGHKLIRIAEVYYRIWGIFLILTGLGILEILLLHFMDFFKSFPEMIASGIAQDTAVMIPSLLVLGACYLFLAARAKKYSLRSTDAKICLRWGIIALVFELLLLAIDMIYIRLSGHSAFSSLDIWDILSLVWRLAFPAFFIAGAYKNMKEIK